MPERSRKYQNALSEVDRLTTRFVTSDGRIIEFAVQYDAFIEGEWCQIVRYDNAHGKAHRHIFYPDGSSKRFIVNEVEYDKALTNGYEAVKNNFKRLREQYILLTRKGG